MNSTSVPTSLFDKAAQLKGKAVQDHKVVASPPKYIVIGNFITSTDKLTLQIFNESSGLSEDMFAFVVNAFADKYDLPIIENFEDSLVIEGDVTHLGFIRHELGSNFSFAHVDEESLEGLIRAEIEYRENKDVIPGSEESERNKSKAPSFLV